MNLNKISKLMKIRKIGGNSVGFSLYKYFRKQLNWKEGDMLRGYIDNGKLIIEMYKEKND